jgi:mannose-1-phosphate guanylyltransferase
MILAGGDGTRLKPLTRLIAGDERPKQFCAFLGQEPLLLRTLARAGLAATPEQTLAVLTRVHERFYAPLLAGTPPGALVVQPGNRGTAPAILYGLHRIAAAAPLAPVVILPSDHYVSDDAAFMRHVDLALAAVALRPDLVVLLGIQPQSAETEYGWIEPADEIVAPVKRIRRFWEKPDLPTARALLDRGCLWNSFVIVGGAPALLALVRRTQPGLAAAFATLVPAIGGAAEARVAEVLYRGLEPLGFSEGILAAGMPSLAVLPVAGVEWSDWGRPARVLSTLARLGAQPAWATSAQAAGA